MKNPHAELEKDADEVGLVANPFEEKLLEELTGLEEFALVEEGDTALKAGIVDQPALALDLVFDRRSAAIVRVLRLLDFALGAFLRLDLLPLALGLLALAFHD